MRQYAPYPQILHDLVYDPPMHLTVHPNWRFRLTDRIRDPADTHIGEAGGLTFTVTAFTQDAYSDELRGVDHLFPVPAATYDRQSWQLWIKDCLLSIHDHEINEGLVFGEGSCACGWTAKVNDRTAFDGTAKGHTANCPATRQERPFAPNHGPGRNPYKTFVYATDEQRRTSFQGALNTS